jgi:arginase
MANHTAILGAPTNLGLKPYADGRARGVNEAPAAYRDLGIIRRLSARDLGDVSAPAYVDFERPGGETRNVIPIAEYSRELATRVASAVGENFLLVLGGDCSILLGTLLGLSRSGPHGLAYIDGHADFATPPISQSGGAAGMDLALAAGRGDPMLARLDRAKPLIREGDVVAVGRKDVEEVEPFRDSSIQDLPYAAIREQGLPAAIARVRAIVDRPDLAGFWVHVDVDVLDPKLVPAVDSPEPGGMNLDELAELLIPLVRSPRARGMELTIYDPILDPDRLAGRHLITLLERVLVS